MNDLQIGRPWQLHWLWIVGLCALVAIYATVKRRHAANCFATPVSLTNGLFAKSASRSFLATLLTLAAMSLLVFAMIDVRFGKVWREVPQKGIEVVFVLDVSRSMLAEDVSPNRLERAKQQISDLVDEMSGDRVGLVLFSGEVRQKIPLTNHYEDFRQRLRNVGPEDIPRGGSRLGDAIRVASRAFLDKTLDHKAIVVFSDGEDMQSDPGAAARAAKTEYGIRIFSVGLGDSQTGAKVPGRSQGRFVQHQGATVLSKLNPETLKLVAEEADGAYIPAGTRQVDMGQVYHGYIATVEQNEFATAKINSFEARFQWFLGPVMLLTFLGIWLETGTEKLPPHATAESVEIAKPTTDKLAPDTLGSPETQKLAPFPSSPSSHLVEQKI